NRGLGVAQEIHGVMIAAATQEGEEIASPIRDAETEHVTIELHHAGDVRALIGDVAELERHTPVKSSSSSAKAVSPKTSSVVPFGSLKASAWRMPGVISCRRSLLMPASSSRAATSARSLPGAIWNDSRGASAASPRSSAIASNPDLVAKIARSFSRAI